MTDQARKRIFAAVVVVVLLAAGGISQLEPNTPSLPQDRKLVVRSVQPPDASDGRRALQLAKSVAARFATAYLARDSARDTPATRRDLQATTTASLWETLREPVRLPPGGRPPRALFIRVNGISTRSPAAPLVATIEYRRAGQRRYLSAVLVSEAGTWQVTRLSR